MMLTQEELEKCENPYEEIAKMTKGLVEELKEKEYNRGYEKGMEDAWETVKWICLYLYPDIYTSDLIDMFGSWRIDLILSKYSAKEAKEKIDNYIKKKNAEFHVGDEIVVNSTGEKMIILVIGNKFIKCLTTKHLVTYTCMHESLEEMTNDYTKTGRHFDEVEKLLKMLKED